MLVKYYNQNHSSQIKKIWVFRCFYFRDDGNILTFSIATVPFRPKPIGEDEKEKDGQYPIAYEGTGYYCS